jgi:DNA-binding NtrC family response regulator
VACISTIRPFYESTADLQKAIKEGRFREDLFNRLNLVQPHMPRLAERRDDIPLLAAHFIKRLGSEMHSLRGFHSRPPRPLR